MNADPVTAMLNKEVVVQLVENKRHQGTISQVSDGVVVLKQDHDSERFIMRSAILSIIEFVPQKGFGDDFFKACLRNPQPKKDEKQVLQL